MSRRGQTSLILIIIAALALVLFAIVLNWGRVTQVKTLTQTAATTGVSFLASHFASYAESVLQTSLGGQWKICKSTSVFEAILTLVIAIVAIVIAFYLAEILFIVLASISLGLAAANLTMQVLIVQPGLTSLWNKMQQNLPLSDQIMEQGLQQALQTAVTDTVNVTDYTDLNTNGHFGSSNGVQPDDLISRFGFFYTERLKGIERPDTSNISAFLAELNNFLLGSGGYPLKLTEACVGVNPADPHCNPCCQSVAITRGGGRPETCSNTTTNNPAPVECDGPAAAAAWRYAPLYPLVYDPTYPNYINVTANSSFLAQFGLDAEARNSAVTADNGFTRDDTQPIDITVTPPVHSGIFAFAWDNRKLLTDPNRVPGSSSATNPYFVNCTTPPLSPDCDNRFSDSTRQVTQFLDIPDGQCGADIDPLTNFSWKQGTDMYCSTDWPYDQCGDSCPPLDLTNPAPPDPNAINCGCTTGVNGQRYMVDALDDLVYGFKQFHVWATSIISQGQLDPLALQNTIQQWYPHAAFWMGPPCDGSNANVCFQDGPDTQHNGGMLYRYKDRLNQWQAFLNAWLVDNTYTDPNAWCLPPMNGAALPAGILPAENAAITQGGAAWGSLQSVANCLEYNAGDGIFPGGTGNYVKFKQCETDLAAGGCGAASCQNLPRSLMRLPPPACDAANFTNPDPAVNYLGWIQGSARLAGQAGGGMQGDRFRARALLIRQMIAEAQTAAAVMATYSSQIDTFLNSAGATALLRVANSGGAPENQLSTSIIYAWRDKSPPRNEPSRTHGYWHAVRVGAEQPGRCGGYNCITNRLAWVRTYTKGFLATTRCYELTDYTGQARMTVTRWDEDHSQLTFANRIPLWRTIFHPSSADNCPTVNPETVCADRFIGLTSQTVAAIQPFTALSNDMLNLSALGGAVMFGEITPAVVASPCYRALRCFFDTAGTTSQACAQYTLNPTKTHMQVKFVPCQ